MVFLNENSFLAFMNIFHVIILLNNLEDRNKIAFRSGIIALEQEGKSEEELIPFIRYVRYVSHTV